MRTGIDAFLDGRWSTIVARQENFRANRGQYWQGLTTHSTTPTYTNSTDGGALGDRLNTNPTDQFDTWLAVFPEWATDLCPARLRIDVYHGPSGKGWCISLEATHSGTLYRRSQHVGPESFRTLAWFAVPPSPY